MLLFTRIISGPADGQVTAGQAEIGLHDMLGAVAIAAPQVGRRVVSSPQLP